MALALFCLALPEAARAYTAAGDRLFPATVLLPQVAPSDDLYLTPSTLPVHGAGADGRQTNLSATYDKTITERLGIGIEDGYNWLARPGASTATGWQNLEASIKYLAVVDDPHELLLSVGADREFAATGAAGIGADRHGATTPTVYLGKGMGDLGIDALRPFAVVATLGYQIADASPRPNQLVTGLAIEYSIPYLESKVGAVALPDLLRAVTPSVEFQFAVPTGNPHGAATTGVIAPGFNYAGEGWELNLAALVPTTRSSGAGLGVIAQLHLSLDFFFPDSIGRPLFGAR